MPTIEQARKWYGKNDPVHGFDHILRVLKLANVIGRAENADMIIVRAAVLLHDVAGNQDEQNRRSHQEDATEFADKVLTEEGWNTQSIEAVKHCIRAHRFRGNREKPATIEAQVVFDADKLDAIGAVGIARAIAYAVKDGAYLFQKPSEQFLQTGVEEEGESHSPYHEYLIKLRKIKSRMFTRTGRQLAGARHRFMGSYFKQLFEELDEGG